MQTIRVKWCSPLPYAPHVFWRESINTADPTLAAELLRAAETIVCAAGDKLFSSGEAPQGLYFLTTGRSLVSHEVVPNGPIDLELAEPGAVLGSRAIRRPELPHIATATAVDNVGALLVRPAVYERLRENHPAIDRFLVEVLSAEVDASELRLHEAVHSTANERVRDRLAVLARAHDGRIRMSQADLAEIAGTTRPTVNRVLQRLQESEIIAIRRARVDVIDLTRLDMSDNVEQG